MVEDEFYYEGDSIYCVESNLPNLEKGKVYTFDSYDEEFIKLKGVEGLWSSKRFKGLKKECSCDIKDLMSRGCNCGHLRPVLPHN